MRRVALTTDAWVQAPMSKAELAAQAHKPEAAATKEVCPVALHNFGCSNSLLIASRITPCAAKYAAQCCCCCCSAQCYTIMSE